MTKRKMTNLKTKEDDKLEVDKKMYTFVDENERERKIYLSIFVNQF